MRRMHTFRKLPISNPNKKKAIAITFRLCHKQPLHSKPALRLRARWLTDKHLRPRPLQAVLWAPNPV
jgi:hypothetical protein